MSGKLVRRLNLTMPWNDGRIEQWLEQMAQRGLHLQSVSTFGLYTFRAGEPAQVAYRIDYTLKHKRDPHYDQLLADAGWSLAADSANWQFWCSPVATGRPAPELFTDGASLAAKYWRWLAVMLLCMLAQVPGTLHTWQAWQAGQELPMRPGLLLFVTVFQLFILYGLIRLAGRIVALRGKAAV